MVQMQYEPPRLDFKPYLCIRFSLWLTNQRAEPGFLITLCYILLRICSTYFQYLLSLFITLLLMKLNGLNMVIEYVAISPKSQTSYDSHDIS